MRQFCVKMRQFCVKNETILHKKWELQAIYF